MANTFKNRTLRAVGTSAVDVGAVVASSTQTTLIGMTLANVTSAVISVTATLNDGSNTTHIVKDAPIPTGSSLQVLDGGAKFVVQNLDVLYVKSSDAASVDVWVSAVDAIST